MAVQALGTSAGMLIGNKLGGEINRIASNGSQELPSPGEQKSYAGDNAQSTRASAANSSNSRFNPASSDSYGFDPTSSLPLPPITIDPNDPNVVAAISAGVSSYGAASNGLSSRYTAAIKH